jgi:hypothetical protein
MSSHLTPIETCREIAGLAPHEMVIGVSPSERHERLLAKYRCARRSQTVARAKIVADLRAAVTAGATGEAADLFIVLRRFLSLTAPVAPMRPAGFARRSGATLRLSARAPVAAPSSTLLPLARCADILPFSRPFSKPSA